MNRVFARRSNTLGVEMHADSRRRTVTVTAYRLEDNGSVGERFGPDAFDPIKQNQRGTWIERLPSALQDEAERLLGDVALEIEAWRPAIKDANGQALSIATIPLEPWDAAIDGEAVLAGVQEMLRQYVILGEHAVVAVALWVVHTYLLDVADFTPYLHVSSPVRGCGKTTLLQILEHLAYRARRSDGITAAALYRVIDRDAPAMLLDELDARLKGESAEMLRGVLNSGFQRGGRVTICVGDTNEPRDHVVFCPKVLSGIGRLWDTVESRSIRIPMERASRAELRALRKIRGDRIAVQCEPLKRQVLRWANDQRESLRDADDEPPDTLDARQADIWRPLVKIAAALGGEWPARARAAATALHSAGDEEGDHGLLMLRDVRDLFDRTASDMLPSLRIVEELSTREDRPWPEYRKDKPISMRSVATLLGRFGIKPKTIRVPSATAGTTKGYVYADFLPAIARYLADEPAPTPPPGLSVTSVAPRDVTDVTDKRRGVPVDDNYELLEREAIVTEGAPRRQAGLYS